MHWSLSGKLLVNWKPSWGTAVSKLILVCHQHRESATAIQGKQSKEDISNNNFAGLNTEKQKPLRVQK